MSGCGKGRFARVLAERYPGRRWLAFDLAEAMLRHVPEGVERLRGIDDRAAVPDRRL